MKIAIPDRYRQLRASAPFESASLGYCGVHLTPVARLAEAQRGYGIVPDGDETDWDPAASTLNRSNNPDPKRAD